MLIGNYNNRVSLKGRTAVPAKFRSELSKKIIITKGYEKTLFLISEDEWEKQLNTVNLQPLVISQPREPDRFILGNAFPIILDDQGRFVIPKSLRQHAQIKEQAVFVGVGNRVEIWDQARWQEYQQYLGENVEKIVNSLASNQELKP
ncbi:division/cell wall cluster transcriptional repressor MraZ [Patescibacteria group bacterium]|nr:division/cell wall cluster transcriptional repressor MraZ [Patescibacteria group bacterium]MBU1931660.1 division/cell wall cluster transcriptional repressor MraZ [Patescibacteria group bacterium]